MIQDGEMGVLLFTPKHQLPLGNLSLRKQHGQGGNGLAVFALEQRTALKEGFALFEWQFFLSTVCNILESDGINDDEIHVGHGLNANGGDPHTGVNRWLTEYFPGTKVTLVL